MLTLLKKLSSVVVLLALSIAAFAQEGTVKGVVTEKSGAPVAGVSVVVEGTTIGATTDIDGAYQLRNVPADANLVFSFIGFKTRTVKVGGRSSISLVMEEDALLLNETVVVGYGTQKKVNLTGAVDQVTSEVFEGRPVANVNQMLQGQIPNLNIKLTSGRPNQSPSFNVRGNTSIGQGGSALVLIDGVEGDASLLNPNDIESVSVLKDAASSAIYGSRAPYGVVLITTKTAKQDVVSVTYSGSVSIDSPTQTMDYVSDGYTWAEHFYTAYYNYNHSNPSGINKTQQFSVSWLEEYKKRKESGNFGTVVSDGSWGTTKGRWVYFPESNDYMGMLYKDYQVTQNHNISISAKEGKFDYYLSGRFYDNNGILNSPDNGDHYNIGNGRMKIGYQIAPWLKFVNNVDYTYTHYRMPMTYSEGDGNVWRNVADEGHPSSPLWNPDGTMSYSAVYSIGDQLYGQSRRNYINKKLQNTFGAYAKFFDNTLRVNADVTYRNADTNSNTKRVRTPYSRTEGLVETITGTQSYLSEDLRNTQYVSTNIYTEYENTFAEKHYFKALLGYNYEQSAYKRTYAYNTNILMPEVENINLAMGTDARSITGDWKKWRQVGSFFRLNYVYDNRYLLEVNGRYDGSSKFPSNSRWAFFPSVSAGWRLTEEHWFNVDPAAVSNIKVRASYGSLGNSNVSVYAYDEVFSFSNGLLMNGSKVLYTSAPSPIPENLTWETAATLDAGLDLSFLNNRLNFTGDWYSRKTKNMYTVGPTLPDVYGASSPKGNFAEMTTTGFEISLSWNDSFNVGGKPLRYSVKASLADYQSVIDKYNNATKLIGTNNTPDYYEGMKLGEIWGWVSNGLWQTVEEIDAAEAKAKAAGQKYYNPNTQTDKSYKLYPGDVKYEDLNGNGYIDRGKGTADDPGDRRIIGNINPRYMYSFGFDGDWQGISLTLLFQGVGKQDWFPSNESSFFWGQYNRPYNQIPTWHLGNYWTEDNTDAYLPRYAGYYGPFYKGTANACTRYLQDVSYIRLKNIQVGYTFPTKLTKKFGVKKLQVYFSGENLWTWSPMYKIAGRNIDVTANIYGNDAEMSTTGDGYNLPTMKSCSFGLNITF
ncbi:MAG: TonB-dependent receptor [Bacteroidales bacterium]|nr:TonB-dependent receptor [Bacteroidales bacterium]